MDLRTQKVAETAFLHLRNAEDELLYAQREDGTPDKNRPVGITMYGPGTKQWQRANAAKHQRLMDKVKRKGSMKQSAAELAAENAEFLVAVTHSFHEIDRKDADDKPLQGEALYRATYEDLEIGFVAEQANSFVNDWANFPKGSTKPSPSTSASLPG